MDRVRHALAPVVDELLLVANDPRGEGWLPGVPVRRDEYPGRGGFAGVHAALASGLDVLAVAWDMPFVTAGLLREIVRRAHAAGADACVPESGSPYGIEPFCAWYSARLCAPLEDWLRRGGGAAHDFLDGQNVVRMPLAAVRAAGDPARLFMSVNTAQDLERARALLAPPE